MLLLCDLDLQFQGHWWPLKGQILAIFSHFGPVLIYRKLGHCIQRIASGGYYGFDFVTPPPSQCVERFHRYRSNERNIIASLLKFAGYIHSHKILPGNIFGLILKNKMAATGVFRL